jgi:hypothetical protein
MAEFKLNRIRFTWQGDWVTGTDYTKDDIVRYRGKTYVCLHSHVADADFNVDLNYIDVAQVPHVAVPKWELSFDGYEWRKAWTTDTLYNLGDYVQYGSVIYICNTTHTSASSTAIGLEADQAKWSRYAVSKDWTSNWSPNTRYKFNDIVRYGGTLYACLTGHTSAANATLGLEADQSKWSVITYANDWKTDWLPNIRYKLGDVVRYGGIIYKCTAGHLSASSIATGIDPDIANWTIVHNGIDYKFAWTSSYRYKLNDIVKYGADLFICTTAHTSIANFDTSKWIVWLPALEFVNSWDSSIAYIQGDIVGYGGYEYVSNTTNNINNTPSTDIVNWTVLVKNYNIKNDWNPQTFYKTGDLVRRDGYLYVAIADSFNQETTLTQFWTLVNPGMHWKGPWATNTTYVIGDVVSFYSSSYICLQKHLSTSSPLLDNGVNWSLYIRGEQFETLQYQGDTQTYNNGSWSPVALGTEGNLYKATGANLPVPAWGSWGIIGKVYYVATTGSDLPTFGTTWSTPWKSIKYACSQVTGPATIFVKTGTYNESLPISVPAGVALVGDELRGTVVQPARTISVVASGSSSITNAITVNTTVGMQGDDPVQVVVPTINTLATATVASTNKITLNRVIGAYVGMPIVFSGTVFGGLNANTTYYVTSYETISSTITVSATLNGPAVSLTSATGLMTAIAGQFAGLATGQTYYVIGSSITPTSFQVTTVMGGTNPVILTDTSNQSAPIYGADAIKDMFYLRNACGVRNMTLRGLLGGLYPANQYGTQRPTGGSYVSLDPGNGPSDTSVWITTKSPYVQNVTNFGQGCTGLKIDGTLHNGGNRSIVANDFTQIIGDGIGCWCTGHNALTELVSVFAYYGHCGYLAEAGGKIRATNGNTSYGSFGCVAEGFDVTETPIAGIVNNRYQQAQIAQAFIGEATNKILKLEYSNAGQNYTAATYQFSGAGSGVISIADEFRDYGIFETRVTGTDYSAGGLGYITAGNQAQAGNTQTITIASNDQNTLANYYGMRIIVTSGTGVGQYGYIAYYDAVGKVATIAKESIAAQTCTATNSTGNVITVNSTAQIVPGQPVVFTPNQQTTTAYNTQHTVAQFTGYISGNTLYVTATTAGAVAVGMVLTGTGMSAGTYIMSNINGSGAGSTWVVNNSQTTGSVGTPIVITGTNDFVTLTSVAGMYVGEQITFTGTTYGNIVASTVYYITYINNNQIAISATYQGSRFAVSNATGLCTAVAGGMLGGLTAGTVYYVISAGFTPTSFAVSTSQGSSSAVSLTTQTYGTTMQAQMVGWENIIAGTPPVSLLDSTSVYSIEPAVRFTAPAFTASSSSLPASGNWIATAYGNGRFIAIDSTGKSVYSTNGVSWSNGGALGSGTWTAIAFGSGTFVAVNSNTGNAATSTDGVVWTTYSTGFSGFTAITYGATLGFMATASGTQGAVSQLGQSWSGTTLPSGTWTDVAYGSIGTWVIIATGGTNAAYSTNYGQSWTTVTLPVSANWQSVTWGNGRFVAVSYGSYNSVYSFDGITWYASTLPISANWSCIGYGQGLFFAVAYGTTSAATSQDGNVWTPRSLQTNSNWTSVVFGNPNSSPVWVMNATTNTSGTGYAQAGATALGRAVVANNKISQIKIWEPGSGYISQTPSCAITDPNPTSQAVTICRSAIGVLGNPTFVNRGSGYRTSTTTVAVSSGDGFADIYQPSKTLVVSGLASLPTPGAALNISGNATQFRIVVINDKGNGTAQFQVSPPLSIDTAPNHGVSISIRQKYSQCRITGHDFLYIGTGNKETTNYPNVDVTTALSYQQIAENNGGRVFQTSTDQDGNFKVGNLFGVQQASGIVTISADQLSLTGLQSISLGGFSLGTNTIVINQFSTDSYFTANSDSIVPTQKAIKSYIARNIAGGGANAQAGAVVAGTFGVGGPNKIYSSTQTQLFARNSVNIKYAGGKGGINGTMIAKSFFAHGFGSPGSRT